MKENMHHYLIAGLLMASATAWAQETVPFPAPAPTTTASAQDAGEATLVFSSHGDAMNVAFRTSAEPTPCEGMKIVARVYDAELLKQKLLPFIAKMQEKSHAAMGVYPSVEHKVKGAMPLQVMSISKWSSSDKIMTTSGSCGPFSGQFTPLAGHHYAVSFHFEGNRCRQAVADDTDPDAVAPVALTPLQCKTPSLFN
jgi:hypothetical protein